MCKKLILVETLVGGYRWGHVVNLKGLNLTFDLTLVTLTFKSCRAIYWQL